MRRRGSFLPLPCGGRLWLTVLDGTRRLNAFIKCQSRAPEAFEGLDWNDDGKMDKREFFQWYTCSTHEESAVIFKRYAALFEWERVRPESCRRSFSYSDARPRLDSGPASSSLGTRVASTSR